MKKLLLITYYWPPSGGSGVQRWLKTVRYLRAHGYEPVIYTVANGEYPVLDESLEHEVPEGVEVIRSKIWEPYGFYKKFIGQKKGQRVVSGFLSENKRPSLTARISTWIRGNLFIPDARKFWIKPSIRFLKNYLKEHPVDVMVSTGPPHSTHMIALGVAKATQLPWVADFRDPWTNIDFYKDLMLTNWADRKHHRMEKEVVTQADRVVVIGRQMQLEYEAISGRAIDLVTNGYDEADTELEAAPETDPAFSLVHIGMLSKTRNHEELWQALGELAAENAAFQQALKIRLIGKVDVSVHAFVEQYGLGDHMEFIDYMKHAEAVQAQQRAQLLLLLINNTPNAKGVITGKIFEYLAARRPIVCIGPEDGDAANVVNEAGAGLVVGFGDKEKLKAGLAQYFADWQKGTLAVSGEGVEAYSRRALTGKLASIFDEITS